MVKLYDKVPLDELFACDEQIAYWSVDPGSCDLCNHIRDSRQVLRCARPKLTLAFVLLFGHWAVVQIDQVKTLCVRFSIDYSQLMLIL